MFSEVRPLTVRHWTQGGPDERPVRSTRYNTLARVGVGDGDERERNIASSARRAMVMGLRVAAHVILTRCKDTETMKTN